MTYMKAWMSYKFSKVLLLVNPILFILAGNDDMHESSEEFEIQPDPPLWPLCPYTCIVNIRLSSSRFFIQTLLY